MLAIMRIVFRTPLGKSARKWSGRYRRHGMQPEPEENMNTIIEMIHCTAQKSRRRRHNRIFHSEWWATYFRLTGWKFRLCSRQQDLREWTCTHFVFISFVIPFYERRVEQTARTYHKYHRSQFDWQNKRSSGDSNNIQIPIRIAFDGNVIIIPLCWLNAITFDSVSDLWHCCTRERSSDGSSQMCRLRVSYISRRMSHSVTTKRSYCALCRCHAVKDAWHRVECLPFRNILGLCAI